MGKSDWSSSKYRDVFVYALLEHINYHRLIVSEDGNLTFGRWEVSDSVAEYDHDPQIIGWNVFGMDGLIDFSMLDIKDYPSIEDVEKLIDSEIEKINSKER